MGAYILRAGNLGTLAFDVVTGETHTVTNEITEHPVESGANVTDHVRSTLDTIHLDVFVSNSPVMLTDRFNLDLGLTVGVHSAVSLQRPGDQRLDELAATVVTFPNPVNYVSETYRLLRKMRDDAELVTVVTPLWDYTGMIIKEVSIPRTSQEGTGAKMTIELKQIRLVEAKLVPAPLEPRAKKKKDNGAKNGDDGSKGSGSKGSGGKQSVASKGLDYVKDALKGFF